MSGQNTLKQSVAELQQPHQSDVDEEVGVTMHIGGGVSDSMDPALLYTNLEISIPCRLSPRVWPAFLDAVLGVKGDLVPLRCHWCGHYLGWRQGTSLLSPEL